MTPDKSDPPKAVDPPPALPHRLESLLTATTGSLARYLLLILLPLVLGPLITVALLLYRQTQSDITEQLTSQLTALAALKELQMDEWAAARAADMNNLAQTAEVLSATRSLISEQDEAAQAALTERFQHYLQSNLQYEALLLAQADTGEVLLATAAYQSLVGQSLQNEPFFHAARNAPILAPPRDTFNFNSNELSLFAAAPVVDPQLGILAVTIGVIRDERLATLLAPTPGLGRTGRAYLISTEGYQLGQSLNSSEAKPDSVGIQKARVNHETGIALYVAPNGETVLGAFRWLPRFEIGILVEQNIDEAYVPLQRTTTIFLLIGLGAVGVSLIGVLLFTRNLARPIQTLTTSALNMARGDLTSQVNLPSYAPREISLLAQAFNHMGQELRESYRELEHKVQIRTQRQIILLQLSARLAAANTENEICRALVECLYDEARGYERLGVFLVEAETGDRVLQSGLGWGPVEPGFRIPPGQGLTERPLLDGRLHYTADVRTMSTYVGSLRGGAEIDVPIYRDDKVIGVLVIESERLNAFTPDDFEMVTTAANLGGVALSRARLFQVAQAARDEAEAANRMKSRFLTSMSHELRTPLNAIINFAYLLGEGMEGEVTPNQVDLLNRIGEAGRHLLGLINDILDLAKIESGRFELFIEDVALPDLLDNALATATGLLSGKPVELRYIAPPILPLVRADAIRIRQVLLNLLSNATKFTERGHITVRLEVEEQWVKFSVQDTGPGIPAEELPTVFQEFVQLDDTLAREGRGTGLGLPISKRFIEMHGGQLWAESQLGVGSTFFFTLPRALQPSPLTEQVTLREVMGEAEARVLVIDDDPLARETVARQLMPAYQIFELSDSRRVLEQAHEHHPDVVVLDMLMPHFNGWEVLKLLKSDATTRDIPVVMCSVLAEPPLVVSLEAEEYLVKPVDPSALRHAIERFAPPQGKVLAVDDDPDALEIVRRLLDGMAYRVTIASDGRAGLDSARAQLPDVVVLDLMMPGLSGFDVLTELRADPVTAKTPVVVITAKDLSAAERAQLQAAAAMLLQKGQFTPHEFRATIRRALARRV